VTQDSAAISFKDLATVTINYSNLVFGIMTYEDQSTTTYITSKSKYVNSALEPLKIEYAATISSKSIVDYSLDDFNNFILWLREIRKPSNLAIGIPTLIGG
jgi:hypothetical protein